MSDDMLENTPHDVEGMGKSDAETGISRARAWERRPDEFPWERKSNTEYNLADRSCRRIHKVLSELMIHGTISVACTRSGMSSSAFATARKNFPSLVEATDLAVSHSVDQVEAILFECAQQAVKDPRQLKAVELILKCKGGWRETQRFEVSGPDGGAIQQNIDLSGKSTADLERLLEKANAAGVVSSLD